MNYTEDMAPQAVGKFFKSGNPCFRQLAAKQVAMKNRQAEASYVGPTSMVANAAAGKRSRWE